MDSMKRQTTTSPKSTIDIIVSGHKQSDRIEDYARAIMHYLMPRKRKGTIFIDIVKKIKYEDSIYCGMCYGDRQAVEIELAKNTNKRLSLEDMMVNLAHELVHAKQFFRGELDPVDETKWKGEKSCTVFSQPWEKEAYLLEDWLYLNFWR